MIASNIIYLISLKTISSLVSGAVFNFSAAYESESNLKSTVRNSKWMNLKDLFSEAPVLLNSVSEELQSSSQKQYCLIHGCVLGVTV